MTCSDFYSDPVPWNPKNIEYPTWNSVVRFYVSRTKRQGGHGYAKDALQQLGDFVYDVWSAGDGCPKSSQAISLQFEREVLPVYRSCRKGDSSGRSHKKKAPADDTPVLPTRKSRRLSAADDGSIQEPCMVDVAPQQEETRGKVRKELRSNTNVAENQRFDQWMKDYGDKLFDVFSHEVMVETIKKGKCFDLEFYEDQKDPGKRNLVIARMRVRKKYYENEKRIEAREARKYARRVLQFNSTTEIDEELKNILDEDSETEEDPSMVEQSPFKNAICNSSSSIKSRYQTRQCAKRLPLEENTLIECGTQTETLNLDIVKNNGFPLVSTRKCENSTLIHPSYLQAGILLMAVGNMSPTQAILGMYIIDTQVYKQKRFLPLNLDKAYLSNLKLLKKMENTDNLNPVPDVSADHPSTSDVPQQDFVLDDNDNGDPSDISTAEIEINSFSHMSDRFKDLKMSVSKRKAENKVNLSQLLPSPVTMRRAHQVAACYLEGEGGKEMVASGKAFLMPDGTSRAKVGKMGASLVQIDGKMRALKLQFMGNEKACNWADTIIFQLQRLANTAEKDVTLYRSILSIVSDSCSVNKDLASLISDKLGLEWKPGQLFCCLHTVLGFQTGMEDVWQKYQSALGHDKMYPSVTGFELDMNDKLLSKQILECFLRLTADRWQARSWNKYEEFTKFASENQKKNCGQELHGNRFGDLERSCAIGVYSLVTWVDFVNAYCNIRNQLSIFLRDTMHLSDICLFLWLGPALLGIHLTEPYIFLLLELKVTHLDLLQIFPQLSDELCNYPKSSAHLSERAFPTLRLAWIDPFSKKSPYDPCIAKAISEAIDKFDQAVLDKYLKKLCRKMAQVLKKQRGNAYNFGNDKDSPELVTKQLSHDDLKRAPTNTKPVENLFGIEDAILERFGGQAFAKSGDDLII